MTLSDRGMSHLRSLGIELPKAAFTRARIHSWTPSGRRISRSMFEESAVHIEKGQLSQLMYETVQEKYKGRVRFIFNSTPSYINYDENTLEVEQLQMNSNGNGPVV